MHVRAQVDLYHLCTDHLYKYISSSRYANILQFFTQGTTQLKYTLKQLQVRSRVALGSLSSSVEQYMPHSANCVKCKKCKKQGLIELLADSGTLLNFTHERSDLSEFQEVHDDDFDVQTAAKSPPW